MIQLFVAVLLSFFMQLTMAAPVKMTEPQEQTREDLKVLMQLQGASPHVVDAMLTRIWRESRFQAVSENLHYRNVEQVRSVFGNRVKHMTDGEIQANLVANPRALGNLVYRAYGGYEYRGRGFIQLSGLANYRFYSKLIFGDDRMVRNPDLANLPSVAKRILIEYMNVRLTQVATSKYGKSLATLMPSEAKYVVRVAVAPCPIKPTIRQT